MKKQIVILLSLLSFSADGRIGESEKQCAARYGKVFSIKEASQKMGGEIERPDNFPEVTFKVVFPKGWVVLVGFKDDKCVTLLYISTDKSYITPTQIEAVAKLNTKKVLSDAEPMSFFNNDIFARRIGDNSFCVISVPYMEVAAKENDESVTEGL